MRQRAQSAGTLKSTPQQVVKTEGQTIIIEPAQSDVIYVPTYDPWLVYGAALPMWPGWYPYPGLYLAGPGFGFGFGFNIGFFGGFGWGWHHWGSIGATARFFSITTRISRIAGRSSLTTPLSIGTESVTPTTSSIETQSLTTTPPRITTSFRIETRLRTTARSSITEAPAPSGGFNHGGITANHSFCGRASFGGGFHAGGGGGGFHGGRR